MVHVPSFFAAAAFFATTHRRGAVSAGETFAIVLIFLGRSGKVVFRQRNLLADTNLTSFDYREHWLTIFASFGCALGVLKVLVDAVELDRTRLASWRAQSSI